MIVSHPFYKYDLACQYKWANPVLLVILKLKHRFTWYIYINMIIKTYNLQLHKYNQDIHTSRKIIVILFNILNSFTFLSSQVFWNDYGYRLNLQSGIWEVWFAHIIFFRHYYVYLKLSTSNYPHPLKIWWNLKYVFWK